ncbi:MAG: peptidoglycan D,D-transpeptidase FtsI family protein [Solirubrobacteraceae bacterium]
MSSLEPARKPDPRTPVAPQMAWRVAAIGTIALVMFGIVFFRLWYLQILSGNKYLAQASAQETRPVPVQAPRGQVLASNGQTLVSSQTTSSVRIVPSRLPESLDPELAAYREGIEHAVKRAAPLEAQEKAVETRLAALKSSSDPPAERRRLRSEAKRELNAVRRRIKRVGTVAVPRLAASQTHDRGLFQRLGALLKLGPRKIVELVIHGVEVTPSAAVTIDSGATAGQRAVLAEHKSEFPGVEQGPVAQRAYPYGEMAAQVFGTVGSISQGELSEPHFKGVLKGTAVGQSGLEYTYDNYLRGTPGKQNVHVNAAGEPTGAPVSEVQPKAGYDLKTTIDLPLQVEAERALREEVQAAHGRGEGADGAAFVAMDPVNGEVLAMGSYPSYNPSFFTKPFTEAELKGIEGPENSVTGGKALLNRAYQGGYATGSTFKPYTAMAALEAGVISPTEAFGAGEYIEVGGIKFHNNESSNFGNVDLVKALEVSSDVYFFTVGKRAYEHGGDLIQKMAHRLGIGDPTGIDLPNEVLGVVPERKWLQELEAEERRCTRREHKPCGYVLEPNAPWSVGDNMNLAIGQGDLLTNPLQMAVAYSTLVDAYRNGGQGWRPTPHLGKQIDNAAGELVTTLKFPARKRHVNLNPEDLGYVFEGIHDATVGPEGTSTGDWAGWNQSLHETYGKTGTSERAGQTEQAWYTCYVASEKHPLVIAVTVEEGRYGAETAAPIARLIADQYFHQPIKKIG